MKYIHGRPAHLAHQVDEIGTGVVLDCGHTVDYDDLTLIVDPTDDQVAAAVAGRPIPPDPEDEAELEATIRADLVRWGHADMQRGVIRAMRARRRER
jgi:hypothetical protein